MGVTLAVLPTFGGLLATKSRSGISPKAAIQDGACKYENLTLCSVWSYTK